MTHDRCWGRWWKQWMLILAISVVGGCNFQNREVVRIAGSSTVLPIVDYAAERFRTANPSVQLTVNAGGSGVGLNQVISGRIQIGMMSRAIRESEHAALGAARLNVHTIALDAVAVAVASEVYQAGVTALTLAQLRAIYSGEITNWRDVGGPDREIYVIDKEQSRGTRHVFMGVVFGDPTAAAAGADIIVGSNNEEQTALVQSDSGIGMLSVGWLNNDVNAVDIVIDGRPVSVRDAVATDSAYPFVRPLNLVTVGPPDGRVAEFIAFLQSPLGQGIVKELNYLPVSE